MKFKYNSKQNLLAYQNKPYQETWYQIDSENQFRTNFHGQGFKLENGWISFYLQIKRIRVFYKQKSLDTNEFEEPNITYYRKYLPKQEEIIFEFTPQDEIKKINNRWVNKGGKHA